MLDKKSSRSGVYKIAPTAVKFTRLGSRARSLGIISHVYLLLLSPESSTPCASFKSEKWPIWT